MRRGTRDNNNKFIVLYSRVTVVTHLVNGFKTARGEVFENS